MDNFAKFVLKKEAPKVTVAHESPEHSELVAREKLEKLMGENFRNFAIRFVNINEYRHMLATRAFGGDGKEVMMFENSWHVNRKRGRSGREGPNFRQWLRSGRHLANVEDTLAPESLKTKAVMRVLLRDLQNIEQSNKSASHEEKLQKIREVFVSMMEEGIQVENLYYTRSGRITPENLPESIHKDVLQAFLADENYLDRPGAIREVVSAISYVYGDRQYHIALLFDDEVFRFPESPTEAQWSYFPKGADGKGKGLLGAVSLLPLKEMQNEMLQLEKTSGDFAHPIFNKEGECIWPK